MVKLATARECRMYGPRLGRNRCEYINAGIYVFAVILMAGGFAAQLSGAGDEKSGLVLLLISLGIMIAVSIHDLVAHMAGIDYRWSLMEFDPQLALVEFAVPLVESLGSIIFFVAILLLLIQEEKQYKHGLERYVLNFLVAGPVLWLLGSIHDTCQTYERANVHVQFLQKGIQIPFLMGSLLFLVAGIFNHRAAAHVRPTQHGLKLLGNTWVWLGISGSCLFLIGGLMNVVKVFKMQQMDGVRLEKLRGGAQERLMRAREGQVPLILESQHRRVMVEEQTIPFSAPTPYKDVLLSQP